MVGGLILSCSLRSLRSLRLISQRAVYRKERKERRERKLKPLIDADRTLMEAIKVRETKSWRTKSSTVRV